MSDFSAEECRVIYYEQKAEIERLRRELAALELQLFTIRRFTELQAEDEGLWFIAETITEDYLQRAIRELHAAIEGDVLRGG